MSCLHHDLAARGTGGLTTVSLATLVGDPRRVGPRRANLLGVLRWGQSLRCEECGAVASGFYDPNGEVIATVNLNGATGDGGTLTSPDLLTALRDDPHAVFAN